MMPGKTKSRRTEEYEDSEKEAIKSGKKALERAPWLFSRAVPRTKGFFAEARENYAVHPDHYSVHLVDGVGTKLFFSAWSDDYRKAPIDAVAMNANDMATLINAFPTEINLYLACQTWVEENKMGEIMDGFVDALERIRVPNAPWEMNIGKMETASLDEMISLGIKDKGVDYGVVMIGHIQRSRLPNLDPKPGNIIVGVSSTGLHSNGFTGARHVLLKPDVEYRDEWKPQYRGRFGLHDKPSMLEGKTVMEAMQVPTALYLAEAGAIGDFFSGNTNIYGVNITGNGLHNFNRAGKNVSFEITDPMQPLPIHKLLAQESGWTPKNAYTKQNMGMGFAYVVPNKEVAEVIVLSINQRGENHAQIAGEVRKARRSEKELRTTMHAPYDGGKPINFAGYAK